MNPRSALVSLHLGALLFGLSGVLGKLTAASPSVIVFGRAAFAAMVLTLFLRFVRSTAWTPLNRASGVRLLASGVLLSLHWVTFFIAVKIAGVAVATLGFASFPAFTVILEGVFFRERIRRSEILQVVLVSVGLILVTPEFDLASETTSGLLWAMFSGLTFALLSLVNRVNAAHVPAVQAALCQNLIVALCLMPWAATELSGVSAMDWLWIAVLGVLCTGLAHSLFVASLAVIKARIAAVVFAMEPLYGIAFAWLIFAEIPTLRMLLGGVLIIVAILISGLMGSRKSVSNAH
jgi:drug/metabolite transporter (DMT)-like permease